MVWVFHILEADDPRAANMHSELGCVCEHTCVCVCVCACAWRGVVGGYHNATIFFACTLFLWNLRALTALRLQQLNINLWE